MAPSIAQEVPSTAELAGVADRKIKHAYDQTKHDAYKYSQYLPVYDESTIFPPTEPFEFVDRGTKADKAKPNLLDNKNTDLKVNKLTPRVGTEILGLQLSALTEVQKDELALLIAERGVTRLYLGVRTSKILELKDRKNLASLLVDSTFMYAASSKTFEVLRSWLIRPQPVGAHVEGAIEFHNIYLGPDNLYRAQQRSTKLSTMVYHSDVSHEHQTPGITILTLLTVPPTGGDTGWVSQVAAYERLSDPIKHLLEGLRAVHSGFSQAESARRDGKFVRREPVQSEHPIVRVHPATGERALFVNPGFTKRIVGLKDEESDAILQLLFKHISQSQDVQVRVRWDDQTVSLWDNRVTAHTAISDYDFHSQEDGQRHGFRITTLGEKPVGVNGLESVW